LTEEPARYNNRERATVVMNLATLHRMQGHGLLAAAELAEALQLLAGEAEPSYPDIGRVHTSLCVLNAEMKHFEQAVRHCTSARELWEHHLGSDHPWVADALRNLAALAYLSGDFRQAGALLSRALEIVERRFGPQHFRVGEMLMMQVAVLRACGNSKEARRLQNRAKTILAEHRSTNMSTHTIDWLALRR
jgi:tetratricopeptide (TPR) repeat protein